MSIKNYSTKEKPVTQFNPQLTHFDFICGQIQNENKILRYVVVISCLAFFLSIGITIYAVSQPDTVPVLVTMNDFGQTQYIGKVTRHNFEGYKVPELAIQYQVKEFLSLYYTLSTDKTIMNSRLNKIYHMLTSTTASKFTNMLKETKPFENFGSETREIIYQTEPLMLSTESYQIDYQINTRNLQGGIENIKLYRAIISVKTMDPSQDDLKDNPLGIYITQFDIKEINIKRQAD